MHLNEDFLRAYIDDESQSADSVAISEHLSQCEDCSARLAEVRSRAEQVSTYLGTLKPVSSEPGASSAVMWKRLQARQDLPSPAPTFLRRFRSVWTAAAAILIVVLALNYEPVRTWAGEFLAFFRVQQIHVVQIDPANVERFQQEFFNSETRPRIEQIFSDNAVVKEEGKRAEVKSVTEAASRAGFGIRLPASLHTNPRLMVQPAVHITYTIDRERIQGILDEAGRDDIELPDELHGETIYLNVPASVTAAYGKCPEPDQKRTGEKRRKESYPECKIFAQLPSPTLAAPATLPVSQMGQAFLQLLGMTSDQAREFAQTINWTSTLVLPLPLDEHTKYSKVTVDGVPGAMVTTKRYQSQRYTLLWVRDGIVYTLLGQGSAEDALRIANSTR